MFLQSVFSLLLMGGFATAAWANHVAIAAPPKGWECVSDPEQLPTKIKVIFIGSGHGNSQFTPSLNLACEPTSLPLKEYVLQAKTYHEGRAGTRCTPIGSVPTASGSAEMLQIDRPSQWGDIRFIQAMLIHEGEAYVVTATCLKSEFSALSGQIFKAIQSLTVEGAKSLPTK